MTRDEVTRGLATGDPEAWRIHDRWMTLYAIGGLGRQPPPVRLRAVVVARPREGRPGRRAVARAGPDDDSRSTDDSADPPAVSRARSAVAAKAAAP